MFLQLIRALMPKEERFVEHFQEHAKLIVAGADALVAIMSGTGDFEKCFHTIREKEGAADAITKQILEAIHRTFRQGLAGLMTNGADPIALLTKKEIYELLESAIDRCEDVMNVIQGIVIEHV